MKPKHQKSQVTTTSQQPVSSQPSEGAQSRPEQPRTGSDNQPSTINSQPRIDFARRQANRQLGTRDLLALLRTEAPRFYQLAEVVGKWVWIQFPDRQPPEVTRVLAQLGFHWNNKRQVWQHPCGPVTAGSPDDPRAKYGSQYAADAQPA